MTPSLRYHMPYRPRRTTGGGKAGNEPSEFNNLLSICVAVTDGC